MEGSVWVGFGLLWFVFSQLWVFLLQELQAGSGAAWSDVCYLWGWLFIYKRAVSAIKSFAVAQ